MVTAPHVTGRISSQVNRFSTEHAPAPVKTPVWYTRERSAWQFDQALRIAQSARVNSAWAGRIRPCWRSAGSASSTASRRQNSTRACCG
ncbi:hypothetical protein FPB55_14555 [Pseudomonas sp. BJP69]|nr:hypothetical protein FPB55_14555 [Pseudomonas sp. BJP69]